MTTEKSIERYLEKIQELKELETEIIENLPDNLWEKYHLLKAEIASDKSVLQKDIKDGGESVEVQGLKFRMSTRTRTSIPDSFMYTAADLGHLGKLIDIGVVTGVKVNEDMIERLSPELAGIYSGLVDKKEYKVLSWPKKADV